MLTDVPITQSPRGGTHVHQALKDTMDNKTLVAEIRVLKGEVGTVVDKFDSLERQRVTALASLRNGQFESVEAVITHIEALLMDASSS